ncbi:peptidoglycan-binding protein [Nonomuraea sp. NPDC052265]|uniref:C40 family peptidase n=1 Tax=Nonomuraea sp. NPDC052265 TaxID=3364374 RepID=UPI0037C8A2DC
MATAVGVRSIARGEIGYRERGVNLTKYAAEVKPLNWAQGQPWCHTFLSWVFQEAKAPSIAPCTASCLAGVAWFKARNRWHSTPAVGDLVYYGPGGGTHVELVTAVSPTHITTVGGNTTGNGLTGAYYNGDAVAEKTVPRSSDRIYGYGRPAYTAAASTPVPKPDAKPSSVPKYPGTPLKRGTVGSAVRVLQARMRARGWRLDVDGIYGSDTERIVEQFQREKRLGRRDGVADAETWRAAWLAEVT